MHFKVSAELPMPAQEFFVERDSAAFRSLVAKVMSLGGLEIEDGWIEDGDVQVFKFVTKPVRLHPDHQTDIDKFVPKKFQHYIGGGLQYIDIIRYDPKELAEPPYRLIVNSISPVFAKQTTIECVLTIEEVSPTVCRQTLEGHVTIRIPGVGSIAERIIRQSLKDVYSNIPQVVERWLVFRDEVMRKPDGRDVLFKGRPPLTEDWVSKQVASVLSAPYRPTPGAQSPDKLADAQQAAGQARAAQQPPSNAVGAATMPAVLPEPTAAGTVSLPQGAAGKVEALTVEGRRRSVALVDGEVFYEPDEFVDGLDAETRGEVLQDRSEAMDWFKANPSSGGEYGSPPEQYSVQDDSSDTSSVAATDSTVGSGTKPRTEAAEGHPKAGRLQRKPSWLVRKRGGEDEENYRHWATFWDGTAVPVITSVPKAGARLGHLFGLAVSMGLVKPVRAVASRARVNGKHSRSQSMGEVAEVDPIAEATGRQPMKPSPEPRVSPLAESPAPQPQPSPFAASVAAAPAGKLETQGSSVVKEPKPGGCCMCCYGSQTKE